MGVPWGPSPPTHPSECCRSRKGVRLTGDSGLRRKGRYSSVPKRSPSYTSSCRCTHPNPPRTFRCVGRRGEGPRPGHRTDPPPPVPYRQEIGGPGTDTPSPGPRVVPLRPRPFIHRSYRSCTHTPGTVPRSGTTGPRRRGPDPSPSDTTGVDSDGESTGTY